MSLQLLEDCRVGSLNEEQKELAQSIQDNSDRLLSITSELLNMTQVNPDSYTVKLRITKPIELIEYAIKANRIQAEKFNIQIEVQYPEEKMGKLFVDSEKIAWVLTNLLSNAIRYSARKRAIIIGARKTKDNWIEMFVRDFGKASIPVITRASSKIISSSGHQGNRVVDWDYPFPRTLSKRMGAL